MDKQTVITLFLSLLKVLYIIIADSGFKNYLTQTLKVLHVDTIVHHLSTSTPLSIPVICSSPSLFIFHPLPLPLPSPPPLFPSASLPPPLPLSLQLPPTVSLIKQ